MVDGVKVTSQLSDEANAAPSLGEVTLSSVKSVNHKSVKLTYKAVEGANGYEIYRSKKADKGFQKIGTVKKAKTPTYQDKKCKLGVTYYYKVRAYRKVDGKNQYGGFSKAKKGQSALLKPKLKKLSLTGPQSAVIRWDKVDGAAGYVIYRGLTKNGKYKKVRTIKGGKVTSSELWGQELGTTYYYKVRALDANGISGSFSDIISITCK